MASTPATEIANGPGRRNVAEVTSVPNRIVEVSLCEAGQRDPGVAGARQTRAVAHRHVVVASKEGPKTQALRPDRHPEKVVVGGALLRLGEDAEFHTCNVP
jgi:hypothetical protein